MTRFRDLLSGTPLLPRILVLLDDSQNNWLRDLGKNDFLHSKSIENLLDRLVPDLLKADQTLFDHGEIFILLAAVYLHDIGRKTVEDRHELESYWQIRENFAKFNLPNSFVADAIAQVCAAHAPESVWPIEKCDKNFGIAGFTSSGRPFNLQRLGALLRIADELENSYVRVQGIHGQQRSLRNLIRDVNPIPTKGIIEIQAQPGDWSDWNRLLEMRDRCQKRLREVVKYLEDMRLNYYQVWLTPDNFFVPLTPIQGVQTYYDMVEAVATVAESHYSSVDILTKVKDCEISVLCTDKRLGIVSRTAILVRNSITKPQSDEIRGVLTQLKKEGDIDHGLVVVNQYPADEVSQIISVYGFPVLTLKALIDDLYQLQTAMRRFAKAYEEKEIFSRGLYVKPTGSTESGGLSVDLEDYIFSWIENTHHMQLTVLGDYGAGKSTLAERIAYLSAKRYLEMGSESRIPILLRLKEFGESYSLESTLTDTLVNQIGIEMSYKVFQALNRAGRFLLILDGFDEIPDLVNEGAVLRAFRKIDQLVNINSKVMLTCRTHFFKSNFDVHKLHEGTVLYESIDQKFGYSLVFVNPFSQGQIEEYMTKWAVKDSPTYIKIIRDVYNLADLATRPALLNIIAKTIPQLAELEMNAINAASLYELYVRFWLERDDWRSNLKPDERSMLAESLTEYLFVQGIANIHFSKLPELGAKWRQDPGSTHDLDILDYELRTCSFLRRDHKGNYTFVHKSFQEYMLARILFRQVFDSTTDVKTNWALPFEKDSVLPETPIATNETEAFFLQLIDMRRRGTTIKKIADLIAGRNRAENIVVRSFIKLGVDNCSSFFTKLMVEYTSKVDRNLLASAIMKSSDWRSGLFLLKTTIQSNPQDDRLSEFITALQVVASDEQSQKTDELEELFEEMHKQFLPHIADKSLPLPEYPFSRAKGQEELSGLIANVQDDAEKDEIKRKWRAQWYRKKTEYDKKQRMSQRTAARQRKNEFKDDLQKKKEGMAPPTSKKSK